MKTDASTGAPEYVGSPLTAAEIIEKKRSSASGVIGRLLASFSGPDVTTAATVPRDHASRYAGEVYRFDTRSPEEIRAAGGFKPRGEGLDFAAHQRGAGYKSGFISTSTSPTGAEDVRLNTAHGGKHGYVYRMEAHEHDSFRLSAGLAADKTFESQEEVVVAGEVPAERVRGVTSTRTGEEEEFKR